MTAKEQRRAWVLTRIVAGDLTMAAGAETLGLSVRQVWRLRAGYERDGPAALVHANRGRPSTRRLGAGVRARIIELRRETVAPLGWSTWRWPPAGRWQAASWLVDDESASRPETPNVSGTVGVAVINRAPVHPAAHRRL